jgi:hypothetical protein
MRAFAALLLLAVVGCRLSPKEYSTIDGWLLCDDCVAGERDSVKAIGDKAVHTLDQALIGPSPGRLANKQAQFEQAYTDLATPSIPRADYIARLRANYIAKYQKRAALSLADIGTGRALDALRRARASAVPRGYRVDVISVIDAALALKENGRFGGTVSRTTTHFGDTVRVKQTGGLPWNGDESVSLRGSPFADSLVIRRWLPDSMDFVTAGAVGEYALAVTRVGQQEMTQVLPLRIIPPAYKSSPPDSAARVSDSFPSLHFLMLPDRRGDTTGFFRLEPASALTVTASVWATGSLVPSLRWFECPPASLPAVSSPATISGYVVDSREQPLSGATVSVVGTATTVVTGSNGRFVLAGLTVPPSRLADLQVTRSDFRPSIFRVQFGLDTVGLGLLENSATDATAIRRQSARLTIPGGVCRFLMVGLSAAGGEQVLRLRLTFP